MLFQLRKSITSIFCNKLIKVVKFSNDYKRLEVNMQEFRSQFNTYVLFYLFIYLSQPLELAGLIKY